MWHLVKELLKLLRNEGLTLNVCIAEYKTATL
jgi:hypothetical protein